ncbi:MAG: hypothetical protein JXR76_08505 [Deltaproteobacteria bacterium]|nr:hypothetical protein [Deltaproteobacteria bacterium]
MNETSQCTARWFVGYRATIGFLRTHRIVRFVAWLAPLLVVAYAVTIMSLHWRSLRMMMETDTGFKINVDCSASPGFPTPSYPERDLAKMPQVKQVVTVDGMMMHFAFEVHAHVPDISELYVPLISGANPEKVENPLAQNWKNSPCDLRWYQDRMGAMDGSKSVWLARGNPA